MSYKKLLKLMSGVIKQDIKHIHLSLPSYELSNPNIEFRRGSEKIVANNNVIRLVRVRSVAFFFEKHSSLMVWRRESPVRPVTTVVDW